ncbi:hypothetical protein [Sphingomonas sp.]|uniref:hypothetical protein n=1 Tax=Sphingomonas sp. TaxID=28214 RepID=UPI003750A578
MRLLLISIGAAITLASPAFADDAPKPEEPRKICRQQPPKTGSNRPGKRFCHTAAEWKARDSGAAEYAQPDARTPIGSTGS